MKKCSWFVIILLLCAPQLTNAQDDEPRLVLNGYVKDLLNINLRNENLFPDALFPSLQGKSVLVDNIVHNRLNLKWYPNDNLTGFFEVRTQMFVGDLVSALPIYGDLVDTNNDWLDLSVFLVNQDDIVIHSMIDRAYLQWTQDNLEVRFGRQRINWGTNLVWNPNDLFNAYNFFDFDYEERPGADALRVKYYTGVASSVEVAVKAADSREDFVAAGMWTVNKWGYDFQVLGGYAREDLALGFGWAGNIKTAGFKGELTWFHPVEVQTPINTFLASMTFDYSFRNSLYLMGSFLYNSRGVSNPPLGVFSPVSSERLTAKDLSPYEISAILQTSYQFHPLVTGGLAGMVFPGDKAAFINPTVGISLMENLDLGIFVQLFYDDPGDDFQALARTFFTRLKWSF